MDSGDQSSPHEVSEPQESFPAPAAVLLALKKTKANIPSTVQLEPPSPKGMLFIAKDLPNETTSVETPLVRSGKS